MRASSAHTWVEAYFPGYGWITFDPTPADPKPALTRFSRMALYIDALGEFWREWVVNYDVMHQIAINRQILSGSHQLAGDWQQAVRQRYQALLHWARGMQLSEHRKRNALLAAFGLALLLLASMSRRIFRFLRTQRIAARPAEAPRAAATIWYERMTETMAQRGCRKSGVQTPQEFVNSILDPELRRSVAIFTQHYELARFGEIAEDAAKLPELYEELTRVE
ncbi:MAG TPA: transglutaminase domain-containing protein [Terriglobales bacterium]|nr:transglutaminase domain-containing protein [Terriglobales bacterium]